MLIVIPFTTEFQLDPSLSAELAQLEPITIFQLPLAQAAQLKSLTALDVPQPQLALYVQLDSS
jgi:hypothetical protein